MLIIINIHYAATVVTEELKMNDTNQKPFSTLCRYNNKRVPPLLLTKRGTHTHLLRYWRYSSSSACWYLLYIVKKKRGVDVTTVGLTILMSSNN